MTITTKFDIGDYAYRKWEKGYFLVKIIDIIIIKRKYNVVGAEWLNEPSITYGCECCLITEHPKYDFSPCFEEYQLYTKEEKEKAESE